jgi:hypothetical protein
MPLLPAPEVIPPLEPAAPAITPPDPAAPASGLPSPRIGRPIPSPHPQEVASIIAKIQASARTTEA